MSQVVGWRFLLRHNGEVTSSRGIGLRPISYKVSGARWSKTPFLNDGFFAQSGEPLKFSFFQFLFLAVQFRHPFGKRLVAGRFELAAECVDFFARKFFAAGHDGILHLSAFCSQRILAARQHGPTTDRNQFVQFDSLAPTRSTLASLRLRRIPFTASHAVQVCKSVSLRLLIHLPTATPKKHAQTSSGHQQRGYRGFRDRAGYPRYEGRDPSEATGVTIIGI